MSTSFTEFHKIWIEQCVATEEIRARFGLETALDYLIGEKIVSLDEFERTKFLAPGELDGEHDLDDEAEEEPWPENPALGAQELLRFYRVRQLLQD